MTAPAPYDPRVLRHAEYARSYHHYLGRGAPPAEAARLAYAWTQRTVPGLARPPKSPNRTVVGAVALTGALLVGTVLVVAAAQGGGGPDDTLVAAPQTTPAPATWSPVPLPTLSPTPSPTSASPTPSPTPLLSAPPAAPVPKALPPKPPKPAARVPKPPSKRTTPPPKRTTPAPKPPQPACHPSDPGACLRGGIGDYDCEGGSGNGPNYVAGPVRVLAPDPFGLDADDDGTGCES